jgi:predicted helicase
VHGRLFEHVWLWKEWPDRAGKTDIRHAQEVDTGDLWAIQC